MAARVDRIEELIRRELIMMFREEMNDPRLEDITITRVTMSSDLRIATGHYVHNGPDVTDDMRKETARTLKSAGGFVRRELAKRIYLKYMPRIIFIEEEEEIYDLGKDKDTMEGK